MNLFDACDVIPFLVECTSSHRPYVRKEKFYKLATADFAAAYGKVDGSVTAIARAGESFAACHDHVSVYMYRECNV